jgi:hypothetical protein
VEPGPEAPVRWASPGAARGLRGGEQLPGGRAEGSRRGGAVSPEDCLRASELAVSRPRWVGVAGFDLCALPSRSVELRRPPALDGMAKEECLNAIVAGGLSSCCERVSSITTYSVKETTQEHYRPRRGATPRKNWNFAHVRRSRTSGGGPPFRTFRTAVFELRLPYAKPGDDTSIDHRWRARSSVTPPALDTR